MIWYIITYCRKAAVRTCHGSTATSLVPVPWAACRPSTTRTCRTRDSASTTNNACTGADSHSIDRNFFFFFLIYKLSQKSIFLFYFFCVYLVLYIYWTMQETNCLSVFIYIYIYMVDHGILFNG